MGTAQCLPPPGYPRTLASNVLFQALDVWGSGGVFFIKSSGKASRSQCHLLEAFQDKHLSFRPLSLNLASARPVY